MFIRTKLLAAVGLAVVAACAGTAADTAPARAAIEKANARFLDAFKRGDKAGMMANYADDAILMMPNEEAWRGKRGMDKGFGGLLSEMSYQDGAVKTEDVMVAGDLAIETGTFEWTLQSKSGSVVKDKGKYLTVWKRQKDGSWKIVRDINNSDLPAK